VKNLNKHDERRFRVNVIRDWLKNDPGMEVSEMKTKFLEMGLDLEIQTINYYVGKALLLINREEIFGPDAQRLFPTSQKSRRKSSAASNSSSP